MHKQQRRTGVSSKKSLWGIILVLLGIILLFRTFDLVYFDFGDFFRVLIPLAFIAVGAWLIIRKRREERRFESEMRYHYHTGDTVGPVPPPPGTAGASAESGADQRSDARQESAYPEYMDNRARYSKFIGDMFIDCENIKLQNVEISGFVGDVEVKLAGGSLVQGLNRMVISGFLGDIRILVPKGMAVFANCSNFVGDIEVLGRRASGFGNNIDGQTANYREAESKLYIAANSFVGDIRIYEV
jgi:lia operon protein LiaF